MPNCLWKSGKKQKEMGLSSTMWAPTTYRGHQAWQASDFTTEHMAGQVETWGTKLLYILDILSSLHNNFVGSLLSVKGSFLLYIFSPVNIPVGLYFCYKFQIFYNQCVFIFHTWFWQEEKCFGGNIFCSFSSRTGTLMRAYETQEFHGWLFQPSQRRIMCY